MKQQSETEKLAKSLSIGLTAFGIVMILYFIYLGFLWLFG